MRVFTEEQHIFEGFYRTPTIRDSIPGSGIGLAYVKEIVERHGGASSAMP